MKIIECRGYELEKAKPNTSEDSFNRSEITFIDNDEKKTLYVLYVRYFDEIFNEFTPFTEDPLFVVDDKAVYFKDIVALVCLLKNPELRKRKRLYINSKHEFAAYFEDVDYQKLPEIFRSLQQKNGFELNNPLEFMMQPN